MDVEGWYSELVRNGRLVGIDDFLVAVVDHQAYTLSEHDRKECLVPQDLSSATTAADIQSPVTTEIISSRPSADMTVRKVSTPKRSAAESWAAWRATGSAASADSFCVSVSSWLEGASAQLVRPLWPAAGVRPTLTNVQARLQNRLALVLTEEPDYVKALDAARRHVAQELSVQRARERGA
jgi:hypothetical protein